MTAKKKLHDFLENVSGTSLHKELEDTSSRYHIIGAWVAIIFDPIFGIVDYLNIPDDWHYIFYIRIFASLATLTTLLLRKRYNIPSYSIVAVPFFIISLQNAFTYLFVDEANVLGHNLNYMALIIGGSMFLLWHWKYSVTIISISVLATAIFLGMNPDLPVTTFLVEGGILLFTVGIFMIFLIRSRYNLTLREIRARLALMASNEEIQSQAEEIKGINENLEMLVRERTKDLERKNKALEEYAFINAHKLRAPVASILGLTDIVKQMEMNEEVRTVFDHLEKSTEKLDDIVSTITEALEKGDDL